MIIQMILTIMTASMTIVSLSAYRCASPLIATLTHGTARSKRFRPKVVITPSDERCPSLWFPRHLAVCRTPCLGRSDGPVGFERFLGAALGGLAFWRSRVIGSGLLVGGA